jgi:uncharacterized integral membrane protein
MARDELRDEVDPIDEAMGPDHQGRGDVDHDRAGRRPAGRWRFWVGLAVGLVVAVAVLLLIVQNPESTDVEWFAGDFTAPLWALLALSAVAGAIIWTVIVALIREASDQRAQRAGVNRAERRARHARSHRVA